jgi:hypothetical protein
MTTSGSVLVLVQPGDTVEAIAAKVRQTKAQSVELLVPADNAAMQSRRNAAALRQLLEQDRVELVVISSNPRVLQAARSGGVATISVEGASVIGPLIPAAPKQRAARPPVVSRATTPLPPDPEDLAMLQALDEATPPVGSQQSYQGDDADFYASLDDLSDTLQTNELASRRIQGTSGSKAERPADDIPAASLRAGEEARERRERARSRTEERAAAAPSRRTPRREEPAPSSRRRRLAAEEVDEPQVRSRPVTFPISLLVVLALIALLAIGALWALSSRVTVTVYAPAASEHEVPIVDEVIPYSSQVVSGTIGIQAEPLATDAEATVTGQVQNQTISPAGRASGVVTVINTIEQALNLPAGTEFVGRNAQGAEVRFGVDAPIIVPGATTTATLTGRSTTYGQIQVPVTARSPGAASNVPENTVKQILIPGQQLIDCGTSNFSCQNGPIEGGSDEPQWIVTEADVQLVLGQALTDLYSVGTQQLLIQAQGQRSDSKPDESTVHPNGNEIRLPENYEPPIVSPPIGSPADPATRSFTVVVRTHFVALGVPEDASITEQSANLIPEYFENRQPPVCSANEKPEPRNNEWSWTWDGASLKLNGVLVCVPANSLPGEVRSDVRDALRGKTRAEAEAALGDLRARGLIGDFTIPENASQLPPLDIMLDVQFVDGAAPSPTQAPTQVLGP